MKFSRTKINDGGLALYTHYAETPWHDEPGWIIGRPVFSGLAWWTGLAWAEAPPQPTPHHVWQSGAWVDPRTADEVLNAAKAARWETIKAARETHEFGGFVWDGSTFDSDAISQSRIQGAMQLAQLAGSDFSINWTLRDNTARALNAVDLTAVGIAMGQHVTASHARARELRAAIESVGNLDDLNKIKW